MAIILRGADQAGPNITSPQYLAVPIDLSAAAWKTQATHEVFTVTGLVRLRIWIECTENLAGAGSIQFGHADDTDAFILTTVAAGIAAGYPWYDATPTLTVDAFASVVLDYVSAAIDIGYEITGAALTDGTLVVHCVWDALNATGNVAVAAGGAL